MLGDSIHWRIMSAGTVFTPTPIPVVLDVLGVNTGHGIYEVQRVVYSAVLNHCSHLLDFPIGGLLVTVDGCPWSEMWLHDWQESLG